MKFKIIKYGINGEGIAYFKNKPVFIPYVIKDEIVDAKITSVNNGFFKAELNRIIKRSNKRIDALCPYQKKCGACVLMHMNNLEQLSLKKEILKESLIKYASIDNEIQDVIHDAFLAYRNKCTLAFGYKNNKLINTMYETNSNKKVFIDRCIIHTKQIEEIRLQVLDILNKYHCKPYDHSLKKGYRFLMIRGIEKQYQIVIITGKDLIDKKIIDEISQIDNIVSIYHGINCKKNYISMLPDELELIYGKQAISFDCLSYHLELKPHSFFQLNTSIATKLYEKVISLVDGNIDLAIEAFSGIGLMGLLLSKKSKNVICIDNNRDSIEDGKNIMKLNNIHNVKYVCDDASNAIKKITKQKKVDLLLVDPPRTGLSESFIQTICKNTIKNIIYVSCNPATLAKNLNVLKQHYEIKEIIPFDMFGQTQHVEAVVLLCQIEC